MPDLATLPPFPGFTDDALDFLRALKANNRRDWFKPRKETYEDELKGPLECLVADAARRMAAADLPLTGDPTASRFRIYRDVRFTDDKRPYKAHVSALFTRSGAKNDNGVVYVHVEPGASFLAAGFYQPSPTYLRPVRAAMAAHPSAFHAMRAQMDAAGLPVSPGEATLTGMPRGFADHRDEKIAGFLKWKRLLARRRVPDEALRTPDFTGEVVRMARDSRPLLDYVWSTHA